MLNHIYLISSTQSTSRTAPWSASHEVSQPMGLQERLKNLHKENNLTCGVPTPRDVEDDMRTLLTSGYSRHVDRFCLVQHPICVNFLFLP